jgi:hypothetical protein
MAIIIRKFRSRRGREVELVECLRSVASSVVRSLLGKSVLICRQTDDPEQILWIGDRAGESDFRRLLLQKDMAESFENSLADSSPPLALGFLDEFYRFPPAPYQVWSLEAHAPREEPAHTLNRLFEVSRVARKDPHVFGMSLYRAVEDPGVFIGFLGLTCGVTPRGLVRNSGGRLTPTERVESALVWRPLAVVYDVGRFPGGERVADGGNSTSRAPFWMRSGMVPVGEC